LPFEEAALNAAAGMAIYQTQKAVNASAEKPIREIVVFAKRKPILHHTA
jgi:hypothetical protein